MSPYNASDMIGAMHQDHGLAAHTATQDDDALQSLPARRESRGTVDRHHRTQVLRRLPLPRWVTRRSG